MVYPTQATAPKERSALGWAVLLLCLVAAAAVSLTAGDTTAHVQPIKVFTWLGRQTVGFGNDNQDKLIDSKKGDVLEKPWYPTVSDVNSTKTADIDYIRNHGGTLLTNPFLPALQGGFQKIKFVDLKIPTDEKQGPSLVLAWGCENGRADLIEKYARGFGILQNSRTKVYIAPTFDVQTVDASFPTYFFAEFAKGDVTVEEAARLGFGKWSAGWGDRARAAANFEKDMGIWGNRGLTLNRIRADVAARKAPVTAVVPHKRNPAPLPTPSQPEPAPPKGVEPSQPPVFTAIECRRGSIPAGWSFQSGPPDLRVVNLIGGVARGNTSNSVTLVIAGRTNDKREVLGAEDLLRILKANNARPFNLTDFKTGPLTIGSMTGHWARGMGETRPDGLYPRQSYHYYVWGMVYSGNAWFNFDGHVSVRADKDPPEPEAKALFNRYIAEMGAIVKGLDVQLR
jgi:hypothetical protein